MTVIRAPLPVPGTEVPFGEMVDAYVASHRVTKKETYLRIAAVTGNTPKSLSRRYYERGGMPWWYSAGEDDYWRSFPRPWMHPPAEKRLEALADEVCQAEAELTAFRAATDGLDYDSAIVDARSIRQLSVYEARARYVEAAAETAD